MTVLAEVKKQALLVGASGGLGSATIKLLSSCGWHLFAADLKQDLFSAYGDSENITPLLMDITDDASIKNAFNVVSSQTNWLDAVINMAGMLKIGSLVELPVSDVEKSLEINLLGVYRVNKQFLPMLLQRKGRIIILSSEVGNQTGFPFNGTYSISKHALEAYSDTLRRELKFLGIKVVKIQPGPFKTEMTKNAEQLFIEAEKSSIYFKKFLARGITYLPMVYKKAHDPLLVANLIRRALESTRPRTVYAIKTDIVRSMLGFIPAQWADMLINKALS